KTNGFGANILESLDLSPTLSARYYKDGSDCLIKDSKKNSQGYRVNDLELSTTITSGAGGVGAKTGLYFIDNEYSRTLRTSGYGSVKSHSFDLVLDQNYVKPCLTPDRINKRQNGPRF